MGNTKVSLGMSTPPGPRRTVPAMSTRSLWWAVGLLCIGPAAFAQDTDDFLRSSEAELARRRPPNLSPELVGVAGLSRFHLTTRATGGLPAQPATGASGEAFSDEMRWTIVPTAHFRIMKGLTLDAALPFGVHTPPGENSFVLGNLSFGVSGGGHFWLGTPNPDTITPRLGIGGAFDVLAPTASFTGEARCRIALGVCSPVGALRGLHAFQPELFVDEAMFFRARLHLELIVARFTAEAELSLSPGFTVVGDTDALMLLGWSTRLSYKAGAYVEPYVVLGNSQHVVGKQDVLPRLAADLSLITIDGRDYSTNVHVTLGLRGHFHSFDPALFVTIDAADGIVIFGLDLAGAFRPEPRGKDETKDFLRGFGDDDPWD